MGASLLPDPGLPAASCIFRTDGKQAREAGSLSMWGECKDVTVFVCEVMLMTCF